MIVIKTPKALQAAKDFEEIDKNFRAQGKNIPEPQELSAQEELDMLLITKLYPLSKVLRMVIHEALKAYSTIVASQSVTLPGSHGLDA